MPLMLFKTTRDRHETLRALVQSKLSGSIHVNPLTRTLPTTAINPIPPVPSFAQGKVFQYELFGVWAPSGGPGPVWCLLLSHMYV